MKYTRQIDSSKGNKDEVIYVQLPGPSWMLRILIFSSIALNIYFLFSTDSCSSEVLSQWQQLFISIKNSVNLFLLRN